jgi:protein-L-isoaspartate O-methyltransferase
MVENLQIVQLVLSALAVGLLVIIALFFIPALFNGPPFVGTPADKFSAAIALAKVKPGEQVIDLGSGDGRFLIALARQGANVVGYEINPLLVWRSRWKIRQAGLTDRAVVRWANFWASDCRSADLIIVYGFQQIMTKLSLKLKSELRPGSRVISVHYELPGAVKIAEQSDVRVYQFN